MQITPRSYLLDRSHATIALEPVDSQACKIKGEFEKVNFINEKILMKS